MKIPPDEWLQKLNKEFRNANVDVRQRPFLALDAYCRDFRVRAILFSSPPAKRIFDWFYENTKREAHQIGSLFTGVFYYDSCFWPIEIPVGYGTFRLDATESLRGMSQQIKEELISTPESAWNYVACWADCVDYGYGFEEVIRLIKYPEFGLNLLKAGNDELRATVAQLLQHRLNSRAAMSSRMAVEIFLKAYLALQGHLDENLAREYGHRLNIIIRECLRLNPQHDYLQIEGKLAVFPEIRERYLEIEMPGSRLWEAYAIAQFVAAATIRSFTDRDIRPMIQAKRTENKE